MGIHTHPITHTHTHTQEEEEALHLPLPLPLLLRLPSSRQRRQGGVRQVHTAACRSRSTGCRPCLC